MGLAIRIEQKLDLINIITLIQGWISMSNAQAHHRIELRALLQTAYMTLDHLTSLLQSSANFNYT